MLVLTLMMVNDLVHMRQALLSEMVLLLLLLMMAMVIVVVMVIQLESSTQQSIDQL